jgi:hypothetical protein
MKRSVKLPLRGLVLGALIVSAPVLAACGGDDATSTPAATGDPVPVETEAPAETDPPAAKVMLPDLTEPYGCGFGFQVGNPEQTAGLFITSGAGFGDPPTVGTVDLATDESWTARLDLGADLFANWCDDVIEMDEPEPQVDETLEIVAGTLEFSLDDAGVVATAQLTALVARDADSVEYALGDITIENPAWGMFAG